MAESFTTGASCSVGEIEARYSGPFDTRAWKDFCDCMFLQPQVVETYFCNGAPIPSALLTGAGFGSVAEKAKRLCESSGGKLTITAQVQAVRTDNWQKCMTRACPSPGGCDNADRGGKDSFNINPGMAFAPWTDFGGSARGIPQRNQGFITLVGQFIVMRPEEYAPLALWKTYWTDLPKFVVLAAKTAIFAPPLVPVVALIATGPGMLAMANLALAQCAAEGKDPIEHVFRPAIEGAITQGTWFLQLSGPLLGQQWAKAGGIAIQLFSKDAIKNGHLDPDSPDGIHDPTVRAVIHLFANHGEQVGGIVQDVINGLGLDGVQDLLGASGTAGIFDKLDEIFLLLRKRTSDFTPDVIKVFDLGHRVSCSAHAITKAYFYKQNEIPNALDVGAAVFECIFDVKLDALRAAVTKGPAAVTAVLKGRNIAETTKNLMDLIHLVGTITQQLDAAARQIGCGIDKLADLFRALNDVFRGLGADAEATIFAAARPKSNLRVADYLDSLDPSAGIVKVQPRAFPVLAPDVSPPVLFVSPLTVARTIPTTAPSGAGGGGGAGLAVVGAGAGFLAAGPVGALVGGVVGLFLGSKSTTTPPVSGFSGYETRPCNCSGRRK